MKLLVRKLTSDKIAGFIPFRLLEVHGKFNSPHRWIVLPND